MARLGWEHLSGLWVPLLSGATLGVLAVITQSPVVAIPAGLILVVQGTRVAYDHDGIGERLGAVTYPRAFENMWPVWSSRWQDRQFKRDLHPLSWDLGVVLGHCA